MAGALLTLNAGSSSIKFAIFQVEGSGDPQAVARGKIEGIGTAPHLIARAANGAAVFGVAEILLGSVGSWAAWNSSDSNSFAADPLFADLPGGNLHP